MSAPAISVILPVYNAEPYLEAAIASILAQSDGDFELLALDDGSTDDSLATLEAMAASDPRIRVISRPNKGLTPTLNEGISLAQGRYIARMDADDIARPERFALQIARLEAEPALVALGGQFLLIDPDGRPLKVMPMPTGHDQIDAQHLAGAKEMAICHPAAMIRKSALDEIGGYREDFTSAQDIDLWLRLAEIGKLANLEEVVLDYRMHPGSVGHKKRHTQIANATQAAKDAATRRGLGDAALAVAAAPGPAPQEHLALKWGWWALNDGHVDTARLYAWRAVREKPLTPKPWRLALCAIRDTVRAPIRERV